MRIDIISVVPALMNSFFEHSICARAAKAGLVEVVFHDLHDYSEKKHKQVDDYPFGGGAGMVMSVEPLSKCIYKKPHYSLHVGQGNDIGNKI